jgi:ubiquinone/menaquinone biosynthesis C-methylase UbiE
MTCAIQSRDYWEAGVDAYVDIAERFTSLFCHDAVSLAGIRPGMTLLDVATGPGALALAAEEAGAQVKAIDFCQAMVERLRERAKGRQITALQMDGQSLDLADGTFDRACSVFGVPLFPDWRAGLAEMARVVRPGGVAVVAVASTPVGFGPNMDLAEARAALFPGTAITFGVEGMTALADPETLRTEMLTAGFSEAHIHERMHDFVFDLSIFTHGSAMLHANPVLTGLEVADRERVIEKARSIAEAAASGDQVARKCTAYIAVAIR